MTSIFLERNLSELPKPGKRRLSTDSHKTDPPGINETFIVKLSPIKTNLENDKQVPKKEDKGLYQKKVSKKGDFKEVRRKLAFTDETEDRKYGKMDFTDKMAAFRTLLKRETPKDPVCNSEKGFKTNGSNSTVGKVSDYLELQNGNIKSINDLRGCLPRTKEARTILSSLADDELSKMSLLNLEAQLYLERHKGKESHQDTINRFSDKLEQFVSSTKSKSDAATDRNSNAKDDYLDKFLKMGSEQNRISNKKEKNRKVSKKSAESHAPHDSDSDLDKIPQRESDSQKAHSCDIDLKCQKHKPGSHALSEAGSSVVDGPGSVRRAANRSIQSNVPHYHPSYPAQRDTPVELLQSSKGKNEEGLCRGIRTGEVIITKTNTGGSKQKTEDLQSNLKGKQRKHSEKGYLTLQDLAERDRKRRQSPEKRSTERQIRKNIMELKKDLENSDSSKENSPLLHRKVHHKLTQYEDDPDDVLHIEELTSGPGVEEGVISGSKAKVFGPRHPESDSRRGRRGQSSDVASRVSSQTGSLRSVGSNSSTVMAVELLRKLYHVDPRTRQDLILKAKCFRRWLQNVQTMQSIDENGLDDFADPLSQTVKEAYVQDSSRQARSHTGSGVARLFESDSVACNNLVHSRQDMHQGFFLREG